MRIRDKNSKLVPFVINEAQDVVLSIIDELKEKRKPVRLIILKARQMGMSTLTEGHYDDTLGYLPVSPT